MREGFGASIRLSAVGLEAPEDIVLGPPKTAFASASGRNPTRSNTAAQDAEGVANERSHHREKYTRDGQRHERDDNQNRDTRPGQNHNRRSIKDDAEMWSSARQPRTGGIDERDKSSKRNDENGYARDKGGGERPLRGFDKLRRDGNQDANGEYTERRSMPSRARDALSWGRDAEKFDGDGENSERTRPRGTRGGEKVRHRDHDRGWDRAPQQDEDPLWMDEPEPKEEKRNGPTQADFEEFRAKMKAGKKDKRQTDAPTQEPASTQDRTTSGAAQGGGKTKAKGRLDLGDLDDALFYNPLLGQAKKENKTLSSSAEESQQNLLNAAAKMAKPSKFSSFFNVDTGPKQQATLNPPPENASSEDKAGFQRILNLLGQQQQQQQQQPPSSSGEKTPHRSSLSSMFPEMQQSPPMQSPSSRQQDDTRSPPPNIRKAKDSEYLLNLMRQPQKSGPGDPRMNAGSRHDLDEGPGISPFAQFAMSPPQETSHQPLPSAAPPPGFFDDHPMQEMPPRDKLNPNAGNQRSGPPGLFDLFNNRQRPPPSGLPPGLAQRPPGFDQLPPGFGQAQAQPQARQGMAPPGFVPPTAPQQQQQRGPNAVASGMFPSRPNGPGMPPPPPGFMNMGSGPPPPGFTTMGFGPDGHPFGGGGGGRGAFDFGQGFSPPGQQRR